MAIGFEFHADPVLHDIEEMVRRFDFTLVGKDQSLGRDLAVRAAIGSETGELEGGGIQGRSMQGLGPDGNPWPENDPKYADYKAKKYNVYLPGELGGQMLSKLSLLGQVVVSSDSVQMNYGTGQPPTKTTARSGAALRPGELKATDTDKADWFFDGGREFFEKSRRFRNRNASKSLNKRFV